MSRRELTEAREAVFFEGFQFHQAPRKIPVEELIFGAEATIDHLPNEKTEELRQYIARIMRSSKPPKFNITREEFQALKELIENTQITILPKDKDNATLIMDMEDMDITKMKYILRDKAYKQIKRDPSTFHEKTTKEKLKKTQIDYETKKLLIPREKCSRRPKLYGLPNIQKPHKKHLSDLLSVQSDLHYNS